MKVLTKLVEHFNSLDRKIQWVFDGGEPLELHDFPQMLKYCKEHEGTIHLNSNGGRIWLDWWAIEPNIDHLNLTYHYWQNEYLVRYILDIFLKHKKSIGIIVPIRPDFFDEDLNRALKLETEYGIVTSKSQLYKDASTVRGLFTYTDEQLRIMRGEILVQENKLHQETTYAERNEMIVNQSPVYLGKLCNTGIERLYITYDGWVSGSICNNSPLGNIWNDTLQLRTSPTVCKMLACTNGDDQEITKFA
jgi:MoaA/NifB/PqqE/SkfB family radical SAM enzyme